MSLGDFRRDSRKTCALRGSCAHGHVRPPLIGACVSVSRGRVRPTHDSGNVMPPIRQTGPTAGTRRPVTPRKLPSQKGGRSAPVRNAGFRSGCRAAESVAPQVKRQKTPALEAGTATPPCEESRRTARDRHASSSGVVDRRGPASSRANEPSWSRARAAHPSDGRRRHWCAPLEVGSPNSGDERIHKRIPKGADRKPRCNGLNKRQDSGRYAFGLMIRMRPDTEK